jgi:hypothetical protein
MADGGGRDVKGKNVKWQMGVSYFRFQSATPSKNNPNPA